MLAETVMLVVGAGPRAVGLLERIAANVPELLPASRLRIHLVDPYPPGAGRVWRHTQSPLLTMNSMAEDVTMFTDDSVDCAGPVRPGPSLGEWAALLRDGVLPASAVQPDVLAEVRSLTGGTFVSRRVQSQYLAWVFAQVVARLPPTVQVRVERTVATRITGSRSSRQRVWLADRATPLLADVVVLAQGHLDVEPDASQRELAALASERGLSYLPPAYSADMDLSELQAGQNVVLRGCGLAFVDLAVLLTEGRGGRYVTEPDGRLRYLPSGREPRLHVGSRRGLPYHAKISYRLRGQRPGPARFWKAEAVDALLCTGRRLDFRGDVWPLMAKEIAWGYYQELFTGHPNRVRLGWPKFADRFAGLDWYDDRMHELVATAVPEPCDRINFERLDRPMAGLRFASADELQDYVYTRIAADLGRSLDPGYSADLGAFLAMLPAFGQLHRLVAKGRFTARSRLHDVEGWWQGFFNQLASGPPPGRLAQLLALLRADIVRFLGAGMWVRLDPVAGAFVAGSASTAETVTATALVEARLPGQGVSRTTDPLLRSLLASGDAVEELLDEQDDPGQWGTGLLRVCAADSRVVDQDGSVHPRLFALGPFASNRSFAAFARPATNAPGFRLNDEAARTMLSLMRDSAADVASWG